MSKFGIRLVLVLIFSALASIAAAAARGLKIESVSSDGLLKTGKTTMFSMGPEDVKDMRAYHWTLGKRGGLLITATTAGDSGECVVLREKRGSWKIVGSSPDWHGCYFQDDKPSVSFSSGRWWIRFHAMQDVEGSGALFIPGAVELFQGDKGGEFCMPGVLETCTKY